MKHKYYLLKSFTSLLNTLFFPKIKVNIKILLVALITFFSISNAFGQAATATWALTSNANSAITGNITATNGTQTGITLTGTAFNASGWGAYGWTTSITRNTSTYYEFTLSPIANTNINLTGFSYDGSYNGSQYIYGDVYYSTDNFSTSTQIGTTTRFNSGGAVSTINTTGLNVPVAILGTIQFRIYFYYSDGTGSTNNTRVRNVKATGTTATATPCSGTPTGGTTSLSPNTGTPLSSFVASVTGSSFSSGLTYQWQISNTGTGGWTNISGATSATATLTADSVAGTTKYYRLAITCTASGQSAYSTVKTFTTTGCAAPPSSSDGSNSRYITNVKFLGTLAADTANPTGASLVSGYSDYTAQTPKGVQIPGGGINVFVSNTGPTADPLNFVKAWVDWNNDGYFNDVSEKVYDTYNASLSLAIRISSTTFGFIVPPGTAPGTYKIRIRIFNVASNSGGYTGPTYYDACGSLANGEAEDYSFNVISDCAAKITSVPPVVRCGTGTVILSATGSGTGFKWYDSEYGGTLLSSASTYTTASLTQGSYTYYVTATNGCESVKRTPVYVTVSPVPTVSFTGVPSICGDTGSIIVGVSGDKEEITLINENFESGLGVFTSSVVASNGAGIDARTQWQSKASTFIPAEEVWFPAINSGSNNFAFATSDISGYTYSTTLTYNSTTLNTSGFLNLKVSFDAYFSYYGSTKTGAPDEGLYVEVSTDGTTWVVAPTGTFKTIIGIGTHFVNNLVDLSTYVGVPNLRLRFRYNAGWNDGVAIDNVRLYGDKPFATPFTFSSTTSGQVYNAADCTSGVPGGGASSVCFKPDPAQLENYANWTLTANATLKNGCFATGAILINNDNKFWNIGSSDWNTTSWKPVNAVPDITKCVVIRKPVILNAGADGAAKSVSIETGGSLQIMAPRTLTIDDYLRNALTADKVLLESDATLLQNNALAVNSGSITAKRLTGALRNNPGTAVDYVYWGSPVLGQQTKGAGGFSPLTPNGYFFSYRESNDRFYETADLTFTPGRGYAVQAEGGSKTYTFQGKPNNGDISYSVVKSADNPVGTVHGYNLVANPYPSNITFNELYLGNSSLIYNTAWFWTNNIYEPVQQGSIYNGNNYSVINGTGAAPATYSTYTGPVASNGIIKVGQAFIIQAKSSGSLNFKNNYGPSNILRTGSAGVGFFQKGATTEVNRFWITLTNPQNIVNTQLIGYVAGATNDFEQDYDNEAFDDYDDLFYSNLGGKKLVIQGKDQNFSPLDTVDVGAIISENGSYTIALDKAEGIFQSNQAIYLKDKVTGTVTNLSENAYTFQAVKGLADGRFEVLYQPQTALSTGEVTNQNLVIYREANNFVVKASQKIKAIDLYDAGGRLILNSKPASTKTEIDGNRLLTGVFVVRVTLENGEIVTKKIRK